MIAKSELCNSVYWTGGTALAYFYLRHRDSYDIDIFSDHKIDRELLVRLVKEISEKTGLKKIEGKRIYDRQEFFLSNGGEIRLEFVHYDFPALTKRKKWKGIFIDSLQDMAVNKTMALIERHQPKDVFDMYFLLTKKKMSPKELLKNVKKKFGVIFPLSLFWSQALFAAKELQTLSPLLFGTKVNQKKLLIKIQDFFERESVKFLKSIIE